MESSEKQEEKSILSEIKISDFDKELTEDIKQWEFSDQKVPKALSKKLKEVSGDITVKELLGKTRDELYGLYGKKRDKAKSFADSRFTPIDQMIERGMVSCGAFANIFGTVLRKFGVPVKFIHGDPLGGEGKENRHSWLEVYDPMHDKWVETDPTHPKFGMYSRAKKIKEYYDWEELKKDYNEGIF